MDVGFLLKKLQDQLQNPATSATDFYNSYATTEDVICGNKNAFSGESLLVDDDLLHKIMKSGNMNGFNDNNASDMSDSIHSKVSHVVDALQVSRDWMLFKAIGGKIHERLNLLATLVASDFTTILAESEINNLFNEKLLYNNYFLWLELCLIFRGDFYYKVIQ